MANKLRMDLELDSKGYIQGAQEAARSTKDLKQQTEDYLKDFGPLSKQFNKARNEAKNLAIQIAQLSDEEKKSDFGKDLAESLEIAIRKAAEFKDVASDVDEAIRRAASDTLAWDAMKEGLDIGKDLATAYAGAVAKLTGNEKALKDMVATVAMVQGSANAMIKIGNALQKQSNIMIALGNVQLKAKAIAEELATKKTIDATVAQKAFNVVAKANPYVLLTTVAVAAAAAIGGYMLATKKSTEEEKKAAIAAEELKKKQELLAKNQSELSRTSSEAKLKFYELAIQYQDLKTKAQKLEFIKENSSAFKSLGIEINNVNTADRVLIDQADDVVNAILKKAIAAKKAEQIADQIIGLEDKIANSREKYKNAYAGDKEIGATVADAFPDDWKKANLEYGKDYTQQMKGIATSEYKLTEEGAKKVNKVREQAAKERLANTKKGYIAEVKELIEAYKEQVRSSAQAAQELAGLGDNGVKPTKNQLTQLQKLEAEVTKFENQLKNIPKDAPNIPELAKPIQENLEKAQKELKDYRIKIGLDVEETEVQKYEKELKKQLDKATEDFKIARIHGDEAGAEAALEAYKAANDKLNKLKIKLPIEFDEEKFKQSLNNITKNVFGPEAKKWDFSGLDNLVGGQQLQNSAENTVNQINKIKTAIQDLETLKHNTTNAAAKEEIQTMIDNFKTEQGILESKADLYEKLAEQERKHAEAVELNRQAYSMMTSSLSTISSALKDLGAEEAAQAVEFVTNSAQMIAQCIQNIAALQAQAIAAGTASGAALPFPANLAAIASIIATITAIFASLAKFENGGVIGGNSFTGDRLLIRANSGERILTAQQNKNFERIANGMISPMTSNDISLMSFRVRGRDLLLVMNNELKSNRKKPID